MIDDMGHRRAAGRKDSPIIEAPPAAAFTTLGRMPRECPRFARIIAFAVNVFACALTVIAVREDLGPAADYLVVALAATLPAVAITRMRSVVDLVVQLLAVGLIVAPAVLLASRLANMLGARSLATCVASLAATALAVTLTRLVPPDGRE